MEIPKPTEEDREYFRGLVPDDARVEVKPMFGNLGAFVNGNMFMGLFGGQVGVKVPDADADRMRALGGGAFGPAGRPMGGYVAMPDAWHASPDLCAEWVALAFENVAALPPKKPKPTPKAKPAPRQR